MGTFLVINAVMIGFLVALLGIIAIRELMK
jgi:Pyruvate/2-oxoacid:ferredoxin oxidoreductase gamma subunit